MKLLAIETSTEACSVALWIEGSLSERYEVAPRRHSALVLPWAEALLAEAGIVRSELDAVACGRGPGAFTGVRLAIALTQGIALALDRPVVAVSTLQALASQAAPGSNDVLAAMDARMGEVYLARYRRDADVPNLVGAERVLAPGDFLPAGDPLVGVGSGFDAGDGELRRLLGPLLLGCDADLLPRAGAVARLAAVALNRGEAIDASFLEPAYLRNRVALTTREREQARDAAATDRS